MTNAEVRRGMLLLRPHNVVVLNGQVRALDTSYWVHDTSTSRPCTQRMCASGLHRRLAGGCSGSCTATHARNLEAACQRRAQAQRLQTLVVKPLISLHLLTVAKLQTGGRQCGGVQPSFFAKLSGAAWPSVGGATGGAWAAVQPSAAVAQPSASATTASVTAGSRQAAEAAPSDQRPAVAAPQADRSSVRVPRPAAPLQAEPRTAAGEGALHRPTPDGLPLVQSPDVIQISSSSSEGAPADAAAGGCSPLEDCLESDRSSLGKRAQPEPAAGADGRNSGGRCRARRRVVLDSDSEDVAAVADGDARRGSTAHAGSDSQPSHSYLQGSDQHAEFDAGGDRRSSAAAAQPPTDSQLDTEQWQAEVAVALADNSDGRKENAAVRVGGCSETAAEHADAVTGADAALPVVRLRNLVAAAALAPNAAASPRRVRVADCSIFKMPGSVQFKTVAITPLPR